MRRLRSALVVVGTLGMLVAAGGSASAGGNPPGNNGVVKVDGELFDGGQANQPHVGCVFQVRFFGFDEGDLTATATFALQPPTGRDVLLTDQVFIGGDPAGGGTNLDGTLVEDLSGPIAASGAVPQPNQGFHVQMTVDAPGSIGATTKHKTFWVECAGGEGGD